MMFMECVVAVYLFINGTKVQVITEGQTWNNPTSLPNSLRPLKSPGDDGNYKSMEYLHIIDWQSQFAEKCAYTLLCDVSLNIPTPWTRFYS